MKTTMQFKRAAMVAGATSAAGVLVAALAACTTIGTGSGDLTHSSAPVTFRWKATGADTRGDMTATLPDGRLFDGPFVQMTRERRTDLDPLWIGWPYGWRDWRWGYDGPDEAFETIYGGHVVANLKGPGDDRMRCRFTLNVPSWGMAGGGQGQCELTDGRRVDAVFPKA
jgi:hypothetical protein